MTGLVHLFALIVTLIMAVPAAVLSIECLMALLPARRPRNGGTATETPPTAAVLVPAHNEAAGISATVSSVRGQLLAGDRLVVIADNCTDTTADAARDAGAEVIERSDPGQRGKGYALDYGLRHLADNPPDVVAIVDADCTIDAQCVRALVDQAALTQRPAQGVYLLQKPPNASSPQVVSQLAFMVKNQIRPLGLDRLGLPCLPTGTGVAIPWELTKKVTLASGNIVEDMDLGVQLALAGAAARICPTARVTAPFAPNPNAERVQRTRWEHGHLQTLLTRVPRLLWEGVTRARLHLVSLAMELAVPPLSLLVLALMVLGAIGVMLGLWTGRWTVATVAGISLVSVVISVAAAWFKFGRGTIPFLPLLGVPLYVLGKIPIYLRFIRKPETQWVRTQRTDEQKKQDPEPALLPK